MQQDHEVGEQPLRRPHVQRQDVLLAQPARHALVGERRVDVPVAQHDLARPRAPAGSRWRRAASATPRTAAPRSAGSTWPVVGIEQQLAQPLADLRAAGLARHEHLPAVRSRATPGPGAICVPLPAPSTPSKAMSTPLRGPFFSRGISDNPTGLVRRFRRSPRRVDERPRRRRPRRRSTGPAAARRGRPGSSRCRARGCRGRLASSGKPASDRNSPSRDHHGERGEGPAPVLVGHVLLQHGVPVDPRRARRRRPSRTVNSAASAMFGIARHDGQHDRRAQHRGREQLLPLDELADLRHQAPCRCPSRRRARSPGSPTPARPACSGLLREQRPERRSPRRPRRTRRRCRPSWPGPAGAPAGTGCRRGCPCPASTRLEAARARAGPHRPRSGQPAHHAGARTGT